MSLLTDSDGEERNYIGMAQSTKEKRTRISVSSHLFQVSVLHEETKLPSGCSILGNLFKNHCLAFFSTFPPYHSLSFLVDNLDIQS